MELPNIYNLIQPDRYHCELWFFTVSHTELYIQAALDSEYNNSEKVFYIGFTATRYFDGPTKWQGLRLRNGTLDEYIDIWRIIQPELAEKPPTEQDMTELGIHHLHIIETQTTKVRVYSSPPFVMSYEDFNSKSHLAGK